MLDQEKIEGVRTALAEAVDAAEIAWKACRCHFCTSSRQAPGEICDSAQAVIALERACILFAALCPAPSR